MADISRTSYSLITVLIVLFFISYGRPILHFVLGLGVSKSTQNNQPNFKSVKIGNQTWMVENLNVDYYRNGDKIPEIKAPEQWDNLTTGAWCYYDNNPENGKRYGKLYNWYAVNDPRGLAPKGWHIPTIVEFDTLTSENQYQSSLLVKGRRIGIKMSSFSELWAGYRGNSGVFYDLGSDANFLCAGDFGGNFPYFLRLSNSDNSIRLYCHSVEGGFSVRCVKD